MVSSEDHRVVCHLDRLLHERGLTLTQLSRATGVTMADLSILKTGRARAGRFSTLTVVCDALGCDLGGLLEVAPPGPAESGGPGSILPW